MNSYEILRLSSNASNQEIMDAHRRLLAESQKNLSNKPDLLKLRKFSIDRARDILLDSEQRAMLDTDLSREQLEPSKHPKKSLISSILAQIWFPFWKFSEILTVIFGPAVTYLFHWTVRILRIGLVIVFIWFFGFSQHFASYRDVGFQYANIMFDDIRPFLPDVEIRDFLPAFLGGRYTYNSSACEKIRLKIVAMEAIVKEEEQKSRGAKILGFGAALVKLAQGDEERAKRYGAETAKYASEIDHDVRKAKAFLENVQIEHLECIRVPE